MQVSLYNIPSKTMNSKAAAASMESSNWHVDSGTYAHLVQNLNEEEENTDKEKKREMRRKNKKMNED